MISPEHATLIVRPRIQTPLRTRFIGSYLFAESYRVVSLKTPRSRSTACQNWHLWIIITVMRVFDDHNQRRHRKPEGSIAQSKSCC